MRLIWKIAVPIACLVAIAGAIFAWHAHKTKADAAAKLAEEVHVDRLGAEQGNADAQTSFGRLYYYGRGVPQDYTEAARWFQKAADQGYARGEDDFGSMYYYANGVARDYAEALQWFNKAAGQGDPWAQDMLGSMYYYGRGVPQDYIEAIRWYRKSADQAYPYAEADLGAVYYNGKAVSRDYAEAARWYRKAAEHGNARSEYDLGYMYRHGQGVPRSFLESRRWYLKAAAQGNQQALRTVNAGLGTPIKISLLFQAVVGLFLVSGVVPFRPNYFAFVAQQKPLTPAEKLMTAAGALLLFCAGYEWYGYSHFKFRYLIYGPNAWVLGRWVLEAVGLALIFYAVRLGKQSHKRERNADISDRVTPGEPQPDDAGN